MHWGVTVRCRFALCRISLAILLLIAFPATLGAAETMPEQRAAEELERVRTSPLELRDFLKRMPKGADLHNHLDGAVYAETFIRVGGEDGLCVDPEAKAFTKSQPIRSGVEPKPVCEAGDVPAASVPQTQPLYDALVDSFSMRGFVPSEGVTGHDHFFATFSKFGGTDPRHTGEFLDEVATRAAAQNEQYLELMETPTWHRLNDITKDMPWRDDLGSMRDELLAKGLTDDVPLARAFWDKAEALRNELERCGKPDEAPGCKVKTRYIYQVFRNTPKELVFAQTVFGLELASADPRIVAINFVGGEDDVDLDGGLCRAHAHHRFLTPVLSQGARVLTCRRARAGAGTTGGTLLPYQARRRGSGRGARRARRGYHVRGPPLRAFQGDGG
jgi:adenosine deaminase